MKKIFCLLCLAISMATIAQKAPDKVVNGPLMTVEQKVNIQMVFLERVKELNLSTEKLNQYETIIDDHVFYLIQFNKKRNKTKSQINTELKKIVAKQDVELKKLLSAEQFKMHEKIYSETFLNAIEHRLNEF